MKCNIIRDLLPLYVDECCSDESKNAVEEHINACAECREIIENMKATQEIPEADYSPAKFSKINDWKASLIQSALLFISFAIITAGVAIEASTSVHSIANCMAAFNVVIPATGFMLSLANWFFVRHYKSRKSFSDFSSLATFFFTACGAIWAGFHYDFSIFYFIELLFEISFTDFIEMIPILLFKFGIGGIFTAVCCVLSKVLSDKYAKMLGKE